MSTPLKTFDEILRPYARPEDIPDIMDQLPERPRIPCECGGLKSLNARRCQKCRGRNARERRERFQALWFQGLTVREIAVELNISRNLAYATRRDILERGGELPTQIPKRRY